MGDPGSFTSLMAMVESHLSKTSITTVSTSQNDNGQAGPSFSLPNICSVRNSNSETVLRPPARVMQLPRFEVKNSDITEILAHQVKNMLMARENAMNEEKEKQKVANEMKIMQSKEKNDDYMIDLSASIIRPDCPQWEDIEITKPLSMASNTSSKESLFSENDKDIPLQKPTEELLPICDNMSYILYQKVRRGKCSSFGKVLTSRLRPVAAPYLRTKISHHVVVPFDFSTPSPCDINKERRLHPPPDPYAHMNMVERFMAMSKDDAT